MADRFFTAASALALLIACNSHGPADTSDPEDEGAEVGVDPDADPDVGNPGTPGGEVDPGTPGGEGDPGTPGGEGDPGAACPIGAASFTVPVGLAARDQAGDIAVDAAGNVWFATSAKTSGNVNGVTKLSPSGEVLLTLPYGSVVATDRAGNVYIAGVFTAPLDVGLGEMQPFSRNDVFVAKLDASGKVVFARALHLCGCGDGDIVSLAVDASGRIAVSGSLIGTAVLDADGQVQFVLTEFGDVAFNSRGDVIIAGTAAHGFVFAFDNTGNRLWSQIFDGVAVHTTSVAVDATDSVLVSGYTESSVFLFGEELKPMTTPEGLRFGGGYIVKLDVAGQLVWKDVAGFTEDNGIAVDASGNVIVTGAETGNAGFNRITGLAKFDAAGVRLMGSSQFAASGYGRGFNVAADACGSIYLSAIALEQVSPLAAIHAYVVKVTQ